MTTDAEAAREKLARVVCKAKWPHLSSADHEVNWTVFGGIADAILAAFPQLSAAPPSATDADRERARVTLRRNPPSSECSCFDKHKTPRNCVGVCEDAVDRITAAFATLRAEGEAAVAREREELFQYIDGWPDFIGKKAIVAFIRARKSP